MLESRWAVLALACVARISMGFQFQAVPAVAPFLVADLGLSYAQVGTLMGLFLAPGVFLSLPGGLLGARFGDRVVALAGLGLMAAGAATFAASPSFAWAAAGRLVSGAGCVLFYYVGMAVRPPVAGYLLDRSGTAAAPLWFGGALWLAILPALLVFRVLQRRWVPAAAAAC